MFGARGGRQAWSVRGPGQGKGAGEGAHPEGLKCSKQRRQVPEASALAFLQWIPLHRTVLRPPRAGPRALHSTSLLSHQSCSTLGGALEARAGWQHGWVQIWVQS